MSESEPIPLRLRPGGPFQAMVSGPSAAGREVQGLTVFNRAELREILAVYGRKVAAGEWRDYAIDLRRDKAVFSVFRRASECPLFSIEKTPRLARRQGAYSVLAPAGLILKRGHDLRRVLGVFESRTVRLVE